MIRKLAVWLAAAMLASTSAAETTIGVTTNIYDAQSTSDDIALSCKNLDMDAELSEMLYAECNKTIDEPKVIGVETNPTSIALLHLVQCDSDTDDSAWLEWIDTTTNTDLVPVELELVVSSDGNDYHLEGKCENVVTEVTLDVDPLSVSDTSDGLENVRGKFEQR